MDKPYFLPDKYAMKKKIDRLEQQLAKANERVNELEKDILRHSVFMEKTAEKLEQHREWQATASVLRRPTREAKQALNKFAIEKQLETAKKCAFGSTEWVLNHIEFLEEQLRKEKSDG